MATFGMELMVSRPVISKNARPAHHDRFSVSTHAAPSDLFLQVSPTGILQTDSMQVLFASSSEDLQIVTLYLCFHAGRCFIGQKLPVSGVTLAVVIGLL